MSKTKKLIATGISLPALAAMPVTSALAKEGDAQPEPPQDGWTFGPVLGFTGSRVMEIPGLSYGYTDYLELRSRFGVAIGASARKFRKFSRRGTAEKFFVPELGYRSYGMNGEADDDDVDVTLTIKESQLVAAFLFQTRWGNDKGWSVLPHFTWGPQLGYVMSWKFEVEYDDGEDYEIDLDYFSGYGLMTALTRLGLGMNLAAGINTELFGQTADFSLRYYQGLAPRLGAGVGLNRQVGLFGGIYF